MSALSTDQVAHLARLARIDLTQAELERLAGEPDQTSTRGRDEQAAGPTCLLRRTRCC